MFDLSRLHYAANREQPIDSAAVVADPSEDLRVAVAANEALRVEVLLLAGRSVRAALTAYASALWDVWPTMASGTDRSGQPASTEAYHRLVDTMQQEITAR